MGQLCASGIKRCIKMYELREYSLGKHETFGRTKTLENAKKLASKRYEETMGNYFSKGKKYYKITIQKDIGYVKNGKYHSL